MKEFFSDTATQQIIISCVLGLIIGFERELSGKDPGLRTFALISMGSCLFTMLSIHSGSIGSPADPGRIAAQVVAGIGFLGAGTIFRSPRGVSGLTTAALMWVTAGMGMAVGFGMIHEALTTFVITLLLVIVIGMFHKMKRKGEVNGVST